MSKFAARLTTTGGTTTLPACALIGSASARIRIVELAVWNTTSTSISLIMCRLSTAGTPGTSATSRLTDAADAATAVGTLKNTYTSTAPTTADLGIGLIVPGAIGSGVVLTWPDDTITIAATANAGIGLVTESGTAPALSIYLRWYE